jgi:hypothetical protein
MRYLLTDVISLGPTSSSSDERPPNINAGSSSGPTLGSGSLWVVGAVELARRIDTVVEASERENEVVEAAQRESAVDVDTVLDGR